jgi:hypothetical protein
MNTKVIGTFEVSDGKLLFIDPCYGNDLDLGVVPSWPIDHYSL